MKTETIDTPTMIESNTDLVEMIKDYISDDKNRIKLDDLCVQEIRKIKSSIDTNPPTNLGQGTNENFLEEFSNRLRQYEALVYDLQMITTLLAYWGNSVHLLTLRKIMARMSEWPNAERGSLWSSLRWYPTILLTYSSGIGAIAADNYEALFEIFNAKPGNVSPYYEPDAVVFKVNEIILETTNIFKRLPGHERQHVPVSEYLFKTIQPILDDLIFLGTSYEELFDRFEILQALVCADLSGRISGSLGRFAWKHRGRSPESSPYTRILLEAKVQEHNWPPFKAGFFGGSYSQFENISTQCENLISKVYW